MADRFDVVILGSGAAGLAAAVTAAAGGASVLVLEKGEKVGGTSAWSGGHVWIPANRPAAAAGIADSVEAGIEYLMSLSRDRMRPSVVRAWVEAGPRAIDFLDDVADTAFELSAGIPDYHAERPGGMPGGGRTLETPLFPFARLGEWAERVEVSPYYATPQLVMRETPTGSAVPEEVGEAELERRRADGDQRGLGQSLIGRLLAACLRLGVEVRTGHRGTELLVVGGRVAGVRAEGPDGTAEFPADRGVVLATGGFEHDRALRREFLRGPLTHPISIGTNEGDGLRMAMRVGAALGMMSEAFWTTVAEVPRAVSATGMMMLSADRARPRAIMVNRHGRRFANESTNYNAFGGAFHEEDTAAFEYRNLPAWLVFDQEYLRRYGTVRHPAGEEPPAWLDAYPSLEALAAGIGAPADALRETVERWNLGVDAGVDVDFHRGEAAHDRWWGDPARKGSIHASLGRVDTPPYYAIRVHPGAMGTKGGPLTDERARVLDVDGRVIAGLYAAGNAAAAPYGMTYGGAGGTLGPALVGGWLAGSDLAP